MGKQKVLTDRLNTYFTKNKITIGSSVPTTGSYVTGDIIISSSPNTNAFGWICTSSGSPGSWKILKSGNDITKAEVEKVLTGTVTSHTHTYAGSSSVGGSANSAVKLATARTMTVGNTSKTFDGTSNVGWSLGEIGALPLTGGNMTGSVNMSNNTSFLFKTASAITNSAGATINAGTLLNMITYNNNHNLHIGSGIFDNKINIGSTYISGGKDVYVRTTGTNGNFYVNIGGTNRAVINSSGITGTLIGNASTATKLATARTINGTNFDGTGAITTASWGTARSVYISDASTANTGAAVSVNGASNVILKLPSTINANLTGNASTASALVTARTMTIGSTGKSFNGTSNVSWSLSEIGAAASSHKHKLGDLHVIDSATGQPIGNSSDSPIGTIYVRNNAKLHAGRYSCYYNVDTGTDYTSISLYNLANKANASYLNIYPDYLYSNKKFHVNGPIRIDGHYLSIQASAPSSPATGDIWIDI